jgi:hypothetical protein
MNPIIAIILILVHPKEFVRLSVEHDIVLEFQTNRQLLNAYPDRQLPQEMRRDREIEALNRTKKIRKALFSASLYTALAIIFGYIAAHEIEAYFGKPSHNVALVVQIIAAAVILVATLSVLGWDIQSIKGQTLAEEANRHLFRTLYWIGTSLFVLSVVWK